MKAPDHSGRQSPSESFVFRKSRKKTTETKTVTNRKQKTQNKQKIYQAAAKTPPAKHFSISNISKSTKSKIIKTQKDRHQKIPASGITIVQTFP
ncbi:hypothetical protein [Ileibacterium valens]|uniref:hypothetical protein n=1 Tax=Ileibacterium valens TaxID=1862668 RepID=UPI003F735D38